MARQQTSLASCCSSDTVQPGQRHVLCGFLLCLSLIVSVPAWALSTAEEITQEATAPNSESNHPLPLMGTWAASTIWDTANLGYTPTWQMQMITQGHHLLLNFTMPHPSVKSSDGSWSTWLAYYQTTIQNAAALNLPVTFNGPQWEAELYDNSQYFNLPAAQNPNVIDPVTGAPQKIISAFGPIGPWQSVGTYFGSSPLMQQLQSWYPNPSLVIFLSNNEASIEKWSRARGTNPKSDQHYLSLYGTGQSDEFLREKVAQGWIDRYRALQQAWRSGLTSAAWQNNSKFVGYEAFGPKHFARWGGWVSYSLYNTNRIDPSPLTWDGGSPSFYLMNLNPGRDDLVFSPQVEAMNYDFMLKEAYRLNPNFWFELSTWNGCDYYPLNPSDSDCAVLISQIPDYTPARYAGMVQFGMWLARPRLVRDFRSYNEPRSQAQPYFDALMAAVDRVYSNAVLKSFWRSGQLVANTSRPHPYQSWIPVEYQAANRMFMLTTSLDPPQPWAQSTPIPVYALARVSGVAPQRQWLVYAFAPTGTKSGVQIAIPGFQAITVDATVAGAFYLVDEAGSSVTTLGNGDPGGGGCTYAINPGSSSAAPSGGTGSVSVTTGAACAWAAIANASWVTMASGASSTNGAGSSTVAYSVSPNSGGARTGTLTVAGLTYTVNQAASCGYSLSATSASAAAGGGTGALNVTATTGCAWTATSNAAWITVVSGASGSGSGTVSYSVAANTGAARSGTLTVAGQTFTVSQAAASTSTTCTSSLSSTSQNVTWSGGSGSVKVSTGSSCAWTAKSNYSWITITGGASGTGTGSVSYSVAKNTGATRSGTMTIAGETFTVKQPKGK